MPHATSTAMPVTAPQFPSIALVGNSADPRVSESMQMLATHLHDRGRRVFVSSDVDVDFGSVPIERRTEAQLGSVTALIVAVGGDGTMLHAARLAAPCS